MSSAKVVAITKPIVENINTPEEFICYAARVSNSSNQMNHETAPNLLKYMLKNEHYSPFEMVSVTMSIETTRDIARQILRHRSFSFQEFSQRYADPTSMEFSLREARLQDTKNRQNSIEFDDDEIKQEWANRQYDTIYKAKSNYEWAIHNGIAKEQARVVLPEGLTASKLYMAGTLRSWLHYCKLRMKNGTQKEHMEIANLAWQQIVEHFPSFKDILTEQK